MGCAAELRAGFPRQFSALQLPFRHLIEGADTLKHQRSGASLVRSTVVELAGDKQQDTALLKNFPLDLCAMVENFTVENCGLQLIGNLWL